MMQQVANHRTRVLVVVMTIITQAIVMSTCAKSEAGPIMDWLRRRRAERQARRLQRQTGQQWTARYAAGPNYAPIQHTSQRVVLRYVPSVQYRTIWSAVPVTQYRPYTTTLPSNGCSVTCMRPCTTYSWQARRVPYTTYRPVYSTITVNTHCPPACNATSACAVPTAAPVPNTVTTLGYTNANAFSPGCNGCGTTAQPYATQPNTSHPYTSQPYTSQPYTSQPFTSQPYTSPPSMAPPTTRPGLPPMTTPGSSGTGLQTPSLDPQGASGAAQGSPTSSQRPPIGSSTIEPPTNPTNGSSQTYSDGVNGSGTRPFNASGEQPSMKPIPYPNNQRDWAPTIPRLLNSPGTTARRNGHRYAAVRIAWPTPSRRNSSVVHRNALHAAPLQETRAKEALDDGGWRPSFR